MKQIFTKFTYFFNVYYNNCPKTKKCKITKKNIIEGFEDNIHEYAQICNINFLLYIYL